MPVYEEKQKVNGQKKWYIRTYTNNKDGSKKQITRHNKDWIGRNGYYEAQAEENRLRNKIINNFENLSINNLCKDFLNIKEEVKYSTW